MKYLEWNNAIIKHFFNQDNAEKEVILYFSEPIIEEIGNNNFIKSEVGYIEDFYQALRSGVSGIGNGDYIQRILDLETSYKAGFRTIDGISFNYPPYLSYFLAFILPFTSGEANKELKANNFHKYVKEFFFQKNFSNDYETRIKNNLKEIDPLWQSLNNWLLDTCNLSNGYIDIPIPPGNYKYAGKFLYHVLLRKEQEEKLTQVFDKENILPDCELDNPLIRKVLNKHQIFLKLSQNTIKKVNQDDDFIGQKILQRIVRFYKDWDGTEVGDLEVDNHRGYSRSILILCLDFSMLSGKIKFNHFRIFTKKEYPEELNLESFHGIGLKGIYQFSNEYSSPINIGVFKNLETDIELKNIPYRWKFNWKNKDFYIFKRDQNVLNEWIQISKVQHNVGKTLILCKDSFLIDNQNWLDGFGKSYKKYEDNFKTQLNNGWLALAIDNITDNSHPTIIELQPDEDSKPKICFDQAFYNNGCFYKDILPDVWIENINQNQELIAVYDDKSIIPLKQKYAVLIEKNGDEEPEAINKHNFTDRHIAKLGLRFKLLCGDVEYPRFLEISEFIKKSNLEIEEILPMRDGNGGIINEGLNYIKGIEPFFHTYRLSYLKPQQKFLEDASIFKNQLEAKHVNKSIIYDPTRKGNVLIHYISNKGKLSKKEFDDAIFKLEQNTPGTRNFKREANYLRYQLQDAGYLDYDSSSSTLSINKPHLLIKPTASGTTTFLIGARDANLIQNIIEYSSSHDIFVEIQTESDELLPQVIYLKFKGVDHMEIHRFAEIFHISFKKEGLYTQFALASHFIKLSNWEEYVYLVDNELKDFGGGELFDILKLKFIEKSEDFDKSLSFIKYSNINGYKTIYRLWLQNQVFNITDQQLGIYLYLYLYKKLREENYKKSLVEKGWVNCTKELEEKERAPLHTNIILYDSERKYLAVPVNCRLPRYLSISIALLNGIKPTINKLSLKGKVADWYLVYKNVPSLFAKNTIALKLNQNLIETPINI